MTGYVSKKLLGAARLPDTPSARAYLDKVLEDDDDTQVYKKPWVGLTDEEKDGKRVLENGLLFNAAEVQAWELGVDYAEVKLKERNA
jgi:hypothetical protein